MLALQEEITSTENKVAFARQAYNDAVMTFNTAIEQFPGNVIAGFGNFVGPLPSKSARPSSAKQSRFQF